MLFIVPTPIGNLNDITLRSIQVLKDADVILAEDMRKSGILLRHFAIETKMFSYHQHNEHEVTPLVIERMKNGENFALISDAGTPGISDAAYLLVRASLKENIEVSCLPGATALLPALILSGLITNEFTFIGFLPQKKGRQTKLKELSEEKRTLIIYESPNRLQNLLLGLMEYCGGDRRVSVSRELTKKFEETKRGSLHELSKYYSTKNVKGEIVVVVEGIQK
ncbi:MAG: 16S rRNA (cytidine(1402)-2'-O)-methyltransferase [Chitinophagales bacterium]|nr:16S rRNA (cytidine(1402)-2'-O)-methyltransferase [Chitinophagales bacterium]